MTPQQLLEINLGFATRTQLRDLGMTSAELRRELVARRLIAIGKSVIARPTADPISVRAAQMGARVACVSAAKLRGLWVVDDGRFHVTPRARNAHASVDGLQPPALMHWTRNPIDPYGDLLALESVANMLMHVAKCQPLDFAVAVFDSAVRKGQILIQELEQLARVHGGRFRRVVGLTSTQADSGVETLTRVRLLQAGIEAREQVKIDGHRVDLLVGERLVIQLDGKHHREDPVQVARDLAQDRRLKRMGYTVLRYSYAEVVFGWAKVFDEITLNMAQRLHLWPAR